MVRFVGDPRWGLICWEFFIMVDTIYITYQIKMLLGLPRWSVRVKTSCRRAGRSRPVCLICLGLDALAAQSFRKINAWYVRCLKAWASHN
jgi:hypothetical protein